MSKKKKNTSTKSKTSTLPQEDGTQNHNSQPNQNPQKNSQPNSSQPMRIDAESGTDTANTRQQPYDGMQNFYAKLPSAEDDSASSDWHLGLEERYAAEVRVRTLLCSLIYEGTEPTSVREKDIYRILQLNEVTDVEALYKTSGKRFVLIFGSEDSALKCLDAELSAVTDDERVSLVFRKRRRAPTFVTLFLPKYISCRAVELAFSNFGEVDRVFYGTHKFNRNLRNGKRHIRILPSEGNPKTLPRKITFRNGVSRDVLYKGKIVNCYRCNTRYALRDDCAEVVSKESDVPLSEQSSSPHDLTPPQLKPLQLMKHSQL